MINLMSDELIFGQTEAMGHVRCELDKLATTDLPVLIEGESGTGKMTVAHWVHAHSSRKSGPLINVSCPTLPAMQLESDLIGYDQNTAFRLKTGHLDEARQGTIFFGGVSELDHDSQAVLLRVLEDGRFTRIGGREFRSLSARLICSSRVSLAGEVEAEAFRKDLFYRLNAIYVCLPPLRRRREDIPGIASFLFESLQREYGVPAPPISSELMNLMQLSPWPGNIRQLENVMRRYVLMGGDADGVTAELLDQMPLSGSAIAADGLKTAIRQRVQNRERNIILRALHLHHWNRRETAQALGITYQGLLYKMRQAKLFQARASHHPPSQEGAVPADVAGYSN